MQKNIIFADGKFGWLGLVFVDSNATLMLNNNTAVGWLHPRTTNMFDKERLILVTNDDGYNAKGLEATIRIARKFGRVVAVAPLTPQSGMSQAITMHNPLFLKKISGDDCVELYALNGTPVDCVKMAFDHLLLDRKVDMVISGINHGSNSAVNILYSGTMGAAIEGSFYNIPSVGLSLCDHSLDADFSASEILGERIIASVFEGQLATPLCLNVNIPNLPLDQIRGIKMCRQNRGFWREEFYKRTNPQNRDYYWLTGEFINQEPEAEDTDEWALANGYVSVVPVQVDMTDYSRMEEIGKVLL